jgi:hypothetical protein
LVLRLNQETCDPCLLMHCVDHTQHHRPPDRPVTEYLTCATIPNPLYQVSYSYHNLHRCPSCRTCHLHTVRQANTILHKNQRIKLKQPTLVLAKPPTISSTPNSKLSILANYNISSNDSQDTCHVCSSRSFGECCYNSDYSTILPITDRFRGEQPFFTIQPT